MVTFIAVSDAMHLAMEASNAVLVAPRSMSPAA